MVIPNYENRAECIYRNSPTHMECEVYGEGDITIKEQNFSSFFVTYTIKNLDSSIKTEKCNITSIDSKTNNSKNVDLFLRKKFMILMILLTLI